MLIVFLIVFCASYTIDAQEMWNIPSEPGWNVVQEGDTVSFKLSISGSEEGYYDFKIDYEGELGISFDSTGNFFWVPSHDLVSRIEEKKRFSTIITAISKNGQKANKQVQFDVIHKNRPPQINDIPVFYVKQYNTNKYNLNKASQVRDPDEDPIVFQPVLEDLPEGASLSELGILSWRPSRNQFRSLQKKPLRIRFIVQDQPEKLESTGEIVIQSTQLDLPPDILIVPSDSIFSVREDEVVNLNLYVTDPNGDENVVDVGFLSNNLKVDKSALTKYTNTQWEFKWTPGYDFLLEEGKVDTIQVTFFAIDESGKKQDKKILISVTDAENIEKKDLRLYQKYRSMLLETRDLIAHLDENQRDLNKALKKAKKGKKHRSIVSATLGAATGISPVFLEEDPRNYVTGVGGTAILTLGTLEATEVIGRSKNDILDKLKINIDIRNQLQTDGDNFARKYALKTKRRGKSYNADIDKLKAELNNKKLILLELPADWTNSKKPTDRNIKKVFPDFNNEGYSDIND